MLFSKTVKSIRISYSEEYDLDNWVDLVDYMRLVFSGKSFKFNDSRRK